MRCEGGGEPRTAPIHLLSLVHWLDSCSHFGGFVLGKIVQSLAVDFILRQYVKFVPFHLKNWSKHTNLYRFERAILHNDDWWIMNHEWCIMSDDNIWWWSSSLTFLIIHHTSSIIIHLLSAPFTFLFFSGKLTSFTCWKPSPAPSREGTRHGIPWIFASWGEHLAYQLVQIGYFPC